MSGAYLYSTVLYATSYCIFVNAFSVFLCFGVGADQLQVAPGAAALLHSSSRVPEYMRIRNGLTILSKITSSFPMTLKAGTWMEKRVDKLRSEERQDLKLMATSVWAALQSKKESWVTDEAFGGAPAAALASSAASSASAAALASSHPAAVSSGNSLPGGSSSGTSAGASGGGGVLGVIPRGHQGTKQPPVRLPRPRGVSGSAAAGVPGSTKGGQCNRTSRCTSGREGERSSAAGGKGQGQGEGEGEWEGEGLRGEVECQRAEQGRGSGSEERRGGGRDNSSPLRPPPAGPARGGVPPASPPPPTQLVLPCTPLSPPLCPREGGPSPRKGQEGCTGERGSRRGAPKRGGGFGRSCRGGEGALERQGRGQGQEGGRVVLKQEGGAEGEGGRGRGRYGSGRVQNGKDRSPGSREMGE